MLVVVVVGVGSITVLFSLTFSVASIHSNDVADDFERFYIYICIIDLQLNLPVRTGVCFLSCFVRFSDITPKPYKIMMVIN